MLDPYLDRRATDVVVGDVSDFAEPTASRSLSNVDTVGCNLCSGVPGIRTSSLAAGIDGDLYPLILFTAWHIALALLPGIHYEGGAGALIGGAGFLGLLWGLAVWRTRDLRSVTIAHVLTNTFAFSGLVLANWATVP